MKWIIIWVITKIVLLEINSGNSHNGFYKKKLKSEFGELDINVPQDRNGTFEPQILPKRSKTRSGMTVSYIEQQLIDLYDINFSSTAISLVADRVKQDALEWQNSPLEEIYSIV